MNPIVEDPVPLSTKRQSSNIFKRISQNLRSSRDSMSLTLSTDKTTSPLSSNKDLSKDKWKSSDNISRKDKGMSLEMQRRNGDSARASENILNEAWENKSKRVGASQELSMDMGKLALSANALSPFNTEPRSIQLMDANSYVSGTSTKSIAVSSVSSETNLLQKESKSESKPSRQQVSASPGAQTLVSSIASSNVLGTFVKTGSSTGLQDTTRRERSTTLTVGRELQSSGRSRAHTRDRSGTLTAATSFDTSAYIDTYAEPEPHGHSAFARRPHDPTPEELLEKLRHNPSNSNSRDNKSPVYQQRAGTPTSGGAGSQFGSAIQPGSQFGSASVDASRHISEPRVQVLNPSSSIKAVGSGGLSSQFVLAGQGQGSVKNVSPGLSSHGSMKTASPGLSGQGSMRISSQGSVKSSSPGLSSQMGLTSQLTTKASQSRPAKLDQMPNSAFDFSKKSHFTSPGTTTPVSSAGMKSSPKPKSAFMTQTKTLGALQEREDGDVRLGSAICKLPDGWDETGKCD
jgi:hypothetical protein